VVKPLKIPRGGRVGVAMIGHQGMSLYHLADDMRLVFRPGKQREFIHLVKKRTGFTWHDFAKKCSIGEWMLYHGVASEKYTLSVGGAKVLCRLANLSFENLVLYIKDKNWGRKIGGERNSGRRKTAELSIPKESEKFGELVGIVLGDGYINNKYGYVRIYSNKITDKPYFLYVKSIFEDLGLHVYVRSESGVLRGEVSSRPLVNLLLKLGLPHGKKVGNQCTKIPHTIFEDRAALRGCVRGLMDTDGSIHMSSDDSILAFRSYSDGLRSDFYAALETFGIKLTCSGKDVETHSVRKIKKYFQLIGSSNLKHILRFLEYTGRKNTVKARDTPHYFETYSGLHLPYRCYGEKDIVQVRLDKN
jgi:hypothetical protein